MRTQHAPWWWTPDTPDNLEEIVVEECEANLAGPPRKILESVMRRLHGKANPSTVAEIITRWADRTL